MRLKKIKKIIFPLTMLGILTFTCLIYATQKLKASEPPLSNQADTSMQKVLDAFASLHGKPIARLTPQEARLQPTPADAVLKVLQEEGKSTQPLPVASVKQIDIPGPHGHIPAFVFTPAGDGPFPVIVYFHGGGFVLASTKVYEASVRGLARGAGAIVVSVDYHLAPEYKYPTQSEEAYTAYRWVLQHAPEWNGNARRVAVAGESAGGNLAAVVCLMARDNGDALPVHALLVYPVVDNQTQNRTYTKYAYATPLNRAMMEWFFRHYVEKMSDAEQPCALPNKAKSLKGLPPVTLITAEIDPLYAEGQAFAERLQVDGVAVAYKHYTGVTHEFFGMAAVVPKAQDAQRFAAKELKKAFAS